MWDDYARSIGTNAQALTQQQKIQAEVNGILEETKFQTGDAAKVAGTYSGQVASLGYQFQNLKVAVGNAIIPIAQAVLPGITAVISALTTLANIFAQVTSLLFGKNAQQSASSGQPKQAKVQQQIADTGNAASTSTDKLSKSTDKAGKTAKQASKDMKGVLANFDDLNILASNAADSIDDASGGLGDVGSAAGGLGDVTGGEITLPELAEGKTLFDDVEISPKILEFVENLKKAIEPTKEALGRLWEELKRLGGFAWEGLVDFYESFLKPVGSWVLGEGLPRFIDALTNGLAKVNWGNINDALHELWEQLTPFTIHVGEGLLWFWENVLVPIGTWVYNNAVPTFLNLLAGAIDLLDAIIEKMKVPAQWLFNNFLKPIAAWTGGIIIDVLNEIADAFHDLADLLNGELSFEGFIAQLTPVQTALLGIAAAISVFSITGKIGEAIAGVNALIEAIGKIKLLSNIVEVFSMVAGGAGTFKEAMMAVFGPGSIIGGIASIIGGAILAITNFIAMLQNGFSWAHEALMVLGVAITALGAIVLGAPALVAGVVAGIVAAVATLVALIVQHCDEISEFLSDTWEKIQETAKEAWEAFSKFIRTKWEEISSTGSKLWKDFLSTLTGIWSTIKKAGTDFGTEIRNFFVQTWNKISSTAVSSWNQISSSVLNAVNTIRNGVETAFGRIRDFTSNCFNSVKTTITGVFSGLWTSIKATMNTILHGVERMANGVIGGINGAVRVINSMRFKIPDWVPKWGGYTIWFNLPTFGEISIPKLANGAVIPPNQQFAAILGDQRSGTNVEAPLTTIKQAMLEALRDSGGLGGGDINITLELDGKVVARNTVRHVNAMTRAAGKSVLIY